MLDDTGEDDSNAGAEDEEGKVSDLTMLSLTAAFAGHDLRWR